jgi:hypothetical protein
VATETRTTQLVSLGNGLEVWRVHLDDLHEQPKNARTMAPAAFNRLVQNIGKGARLESLPFCAFGDDGKVHIISGHHRVRAARGAEVMEIPVLVDVGGMARSQVVAKQLAHNAIQGVDDRDMLAQLYQEMDKLEDMLESYIDPKALGIAPQLDMASIQDIRVAFDVKTVVFSFLPSQLEDFNRACDGIPSDTSYLGVVAVDTYDKFVDTVRKLGRETEIRSVGALITKMCDLSLEWLEAQKVEDGREKE